MSPAAALQSIQADPALAPVQLRAACRQPTVPGWEVSRAVLVGKLAVLCLGGVNSKQKKEKKIIQKSVSFLAIPFVPY